MTCTVKRSIHLNLKDSIYRYRDATWSKQLHIVVLDIVWSTG